MSYDEVFSICAVSQALFTKNLLELTDPSFDLEKYSCTTEAAQFTTLFLYYSSRSSFQMCHRNFKCELDDGRKGKVLLDILTFSSMGSWLSLYVI